MNIGQILIIDDDARNIFALSAVLKARKFSCLSATGVRPAIEKMREQLPDVILLDMMMPDIDGYEGIALLKAHPDFKDIPIISVTAQAMQGDREKCLSAGADGYISKPVDVDALIQLFTQL